MVSGIRDGLHAMNRAELIALDRPDVRPQLLTRWRDARAITDALFASLDEAKLYERPIAERHRIVFYLGHLEAFDWNLLTQRRTVVTPVNTGFNQLFAFGIDPVGTGLPQDLPGDWPDLPDILAYRQTVREALDGLIESLPMSWAGPWAGGGGRHFDVACLLNVAIEHRLMHAETLAYMLHRLPVGAMRTGALTTSRPTEACASLTTDMVRVPAGRVTLGESRDNGEDFGWDNEFPACEVAVPAFDIDRHMVTNGQYLAFMREGGYERAEFWRPEDWAWRESQGIRQPVFWRCDRDGWWLRAMHEELPLPLDWPVYVSHAEASAYARWAGKALPTEAQWMRAATGCQPLRMDEEQCNADFRRWDPEPVQAARQFSDFGVAGLFGNGWEWTSSAFAPADGFEAFPFYPGYSRDFFDGRHFVMKGGSPRTAACMLRPAFRNWFQPHYQHVYAGLRCVSAD
jgi:ergothioneine biosynthesis protein EgtB